MGSYQPYNPSSLINEASNIRTGDNPAYARADFLTFYPQFTSLLPDTVIDKIIERAHATVLEVRWRENWEQGMHDFVAHNCVMYMIKVGEGTPTAAKVIASAQPKGLQSSKSVGDVSVSYDFSTNSDDFKGYANYAMTAYGRDFATMAKRIGKGAVYVW